MARQIYVNLPVKDLDRSVAFFTRLGFSFNPQFTDKNATCMVIGADSFVMLLVEDFFKTFSSKPLADARQMTEVLLALSCDSRQQVDEMVRQALAAGGTAPRAAQDHGFMYQHGFDDLDGHAWEVMYMDVSAMPPQS